MSLIRILGIGSPHGEDDLGWRAIEALESTDLSDRLRSHALELRRLDRPGPSLVEALPGADIVLILDAMSSGSAPGSMRRLHHAELETVLAPLSSHGLDVPASLALAGALGMVEPPIAVIGIEMGMDSIQERVHLLPDFAERLCDLVEQEINRLTSPADCAPTGTRPGV